jgi:hypothetical protein
MFRWFLVFPIIFATELHIRINQYLFQNVHDIENVKMSSRELSIIFRVRRFATVRCTISYTRRISPPVREEACFIQVIDTNVVKKIQ